MVVHELLWRRMGLLVRDDRGRWRIMHQFLQNYLTVIGNENARRIRRRRSMRLAAASVAMVLMAALAVCVWAWETRPYDEKLSERVLDSTFSSFCLIARVTDSTAQFLEGECGEAEAEALRIELEAQQQAREVEIDGVALMEKTLESGTRLKTTGLPLSADDIRQLDALADHCLEWQLEELDALEAARAVTDSSKWPEVCGDFADKWGAATDTMYGYAVTLCRGALLEQLDVIEKRDPVLYKRYSRVLDNYPMTDVGATETQLQTAEWAVKDTVVYGRYLLETQKREGGGE